MIECDHRPYGYDDEWRPDYHSVGFGNCPCNPRYPEGSET